MLTVGNVGVRPDLPSAWHLPAGLRVAGLLVVPGLWSGLGLSGLGLSPDRLASGARWGGAAAALVLVPVLVGVLLPITRGFYDVPRAHVGFGELLLNVLVIIPVGTIIVEEVGFRGTLLGLLTVIVPGARAIAASALLFGLWHLEPVLTNTHGSGTQVALVGLGTVAATSVAGRRVLLAAAAFRQPARAHPRAPGHQHTRARSRLDPGALTWAHSSHACHRDNALPRRSTLRRSCCSWRSPRPPHGPCCAGPSRSHRMT